MSVDAYQGITVLNTDAKVYATLLLLRHLVQDMEKQVHDAQHGFRSCRGMMHSAARCMASAAAGA